ncbi:MAG: hypothetical protein D6B25_11290 [Desulfobulbaceae bacterium]|nr:MAG: hypothetical protein D6B25_11290 [Desulfobulbaceae bacterium]
MNRIIMFWFSFWFKIIKPVVGDLLKSYHDLLPLNSICGAMRMVNDRHHRQIHKDEGDKGTVE